MMLALGMFVFMRQTLPYQNIQREADYRWPSNSRIGKRDAFQFLGVGEEKINLSGVLYPELTGGRLTMTAVRLMGCTLLIVSGKRAVFSFPMVHPEKLISP